MSMEKDKNLSDDELGEVSGGTEGEDGLIALYNDQLVCPGCTKANEKECGRCGLFNHTTKKCYNAS